MNRFIALAIDSDALAEAGVNSLVGIVIVFLSLLFISFIISLFKYIGKAGNKQDAKQDVAAQGIANTVSQIAESELEINNFELTAIITAAIAEYEEAQGNAFKNGIVVRSIKKLN